MLCHFCSMPDSVATNLVVGGMGFAAAGVRFTAAVRSAATRRWSMGCAMGGGARWCGVGCGTTRRCRMRTACG
jgi:hypothetical protein